MRTVGGAGFEVKWRTEVLLQERNRYLVPLVGWLHIELVDLFATFAIFDGWLVRLETCWKAGLSIICRSIEGNYPVEVLRSLIMTLWEGSRHVISGIRGPRATRTSAGWLTQKYGQSSHLPNSDICSHSLEKTMRQPLSTIFCLFLTSMIPPLLIIAHSGGHHDPQQQVLENQETDWATRHMIEEHHISNLDPGAFFSLHDYDSSTAWTPGEILRTYGLDDASSRDVPESKRQEVVRGVLDLFDQNGDGIVSRDEWVVGWGRGGRLPDFGV